MTIPVTTRGRYHQRIDETRVQEPTWARDHWRLLRQTYSAAPAFETYADRIAALYDGCHWTSLSEINRRFVQEICDILDITTQLRSSTDYGSEASSAERLIELSVKAGAHEYLSGLAARAYLDEAQFERAGIGVRWMDYTGYAEYPQLYPPFEHAVSVLDLIFHTGEHAPSFMLSGSCRGGR